MGRAMPSNKETLFQRHICAFLEREHGYLPLQKSELPQQELHVVESHLLNFIKATQPEQYAELEDQLGLATDREILQALYAACGKAIAQPHVQACLARTVGLVGKSAD